MVDEIVKFDGEGQRQNIIVKKSTSTSLINRIRSYINVVQDERKTMIDTSTLPSKVASTIKQIIYQFAFLSTIIIAMIRLLYFSVILDKERYETWFKVCNVFIAFFNYITIQRRNLTSSKNRQTNSYIGQILSFLTGDDTVAIQTDMDTYQSMDPSIHAKRMRLTQKLLSECRYEFMMLSLIAASYIIIITIRAFNYDLNSRLSVNLVSKTTSHITDVEQACSMSRAEIMTMRILAYGLIPFVSEFFFIVGIFAASSFFSFGSISEAIAMCVFRIPLGILTACLAIACQIILNLGYVATRMHSRYLSSIWYIIENYSALSIMYTGMKNISNAILTMVVYTWSMSNLTVLNDGVSHYSFYYDNENLPMIIGGVIFDLKLSKKYDEICDLFVQSLKKILAKKDVFIEIFGDKYVNSGSFSRYIKLITSSSNALETFDGTTTLLVRLSWSLFTLASDAFDATIVKWITLLPMHISAATMIQTCYNMGRFGTFLLAFLSFYLLCITPIMMTSYLSSVIVPMGILAFTASGITNFIFLLFLTSIFGLVTYYLCYTIEKLVDQKYFSIGLSIS